MAGLGKNFTEQDIDKYVSNLENAASRKQNHEITKINSFYDGYVQALNDIRKQMVCDIEYQKS